MRNIKILLPVQILILLCMAVQLRGSYYESGYEAYIIKDYDKAIEDFAKSLNEKEGQRRAVYYISESYLRRGLKHFGDGSYRKAGEDLTRAKMILTEALKIEAYAEDHKSYLKTLKSVNDAQGLLSRYEAEGVGIYVGLLGGSGILLIVIFLVIRRLGSGRRIPKKKQVLSDKIKETLEELNASFFKTKELLKGRSEEELLLFIEETEDKCIMLNDKYEEALYGLRDIDEEVFKAEIRDTKESINKFLSKEVLLSK